MAAQPVPVRLLTQRIALPETISIRGWMVRNGVDQRMQLTDREFWLLLLGIAYGIKFSEAFDRSGADQVIENVAQKVPDVADQARQFAELAMDLPNEMRPTMGDLLRVQIARLHGIRAGRGGNEARRTT